MSNLFARRGILRGLAALPLVGGGVTLIGQPRASAEPLTPELLQSYNAWLWAERRVLCSFLEPGGYDLWRNPPIDNKGGTYHAVDKIGRLQPSKGPLDRAAIVLSVVGCDWKG